MVWLLSVPAGRGRAGVCGGCGGDRWGASPRRSLRRAGNVTAAERGGVAMAAALRHGDGDNSFSN